MSETPNTFEVAANFHFGVKIPGEVRGGPKYSSEEFGGSLTLKETVEAANEAEARQVGSLRLAALAQQVKLFVANEAGLDTITDENGVIAVKLPTGSQVVANTATVEAFDPTPDDSAAIGTVGRDDAIGQSAAPAPQPAPQGRIEWDGRPVRIFDNRPKKQNGDINPNSPDLNAKYLDVDDSAPPQVKYEGAWLTNKDGSPSKKGSRMLALYEEQQRRWQASQQQGQGGYGPDEAPF